MVLDLFVNFCILFTFAMLLFWVARQQNQTKFPLLRKFPGYSIGLLSGVFGMVLMLKSIHVGDAIIIDGRMAVLALSGLFGGPVAPIIAGTIMGMARILVNEITWPAIIAGTNTIIIGLIIGLIARRIPITFQNAWKYFAYTTIQTVLVIGYLSFANDFVAGRGAVFILYSFISFAIVYVTLLKMDQLSREVEQIEQHSATDYLTGIPNNRKFEERFYNWRQERESFHLAVLDIDYFKRVNDTYGHPTGDLVLIELADRLNRTTSSFGGEIARIGGEEFGALLPATTKLHALEQAELLRRSIDSTRFQLPDGLELRITISIGVASYPEDAEAMPDLYKKADDRLYDAKLGGRNCVRISS